MTDQEFLNSQAYKDIKQVLNDQRNGKSCECSE